MAGVGMASCETWTSTRNGQEAIPEEQWVLGFLTDIAAATRGGAAALC